MVAAQQALSLEMDRYRAGTDSYLNVITTQTIALGDEQTAITILQRQMSAQGLGLRGDMMASQQRMQTYMTKAQAAVQAKDVQGTRRHLDLAQPKWKSLKSSSAGKFPVAGCHTSSAVWHPALLGV